MVHLSKKSQAKGRSAELELCRILQGYGFDAEPGTPLNYGREPDISGLPGIHCEVKRCEQLRLQEWLDQARHDAEKFHDGLPAVFHRKNRAEWLVTMPLTAWIALYDPTKTQENPNLKVEHKKGVRLVKQIRSKNPEILEALNNKKCAKMRT